MQASHHVPELQLGKGAHSASARMYPETAWAAREGATGGETLGDT